MKNRYLTKDVIQRFLEYLDAEERSEATKEKYARDVISFQRFLFGAEVTKERVVSYKRLLLERGYAERSGRPHPYGQSNGFVRQNVQTECRIMLNIPSVPRCDYRILQLNSTSGFRHKRPHLWEQSPTNRTVRLLSLRRKAGERSCSRMVLLDLEWVKETKKVKRLTQLSAIRLDDTWETVDGIEVFVNPGSKQLQNPDHVSLGKYAPERFLRGVTEKACMQRLEKWLLPDDDIIVWETGNQEYFSKLWYQHAKQLRPRVYAIANYVRNKILKNHAKASPCKLLSSWGEAVLKPEHRASNDAENFRRLLKNLKITKAQLDDADSTVLLLRPSQKDTNRSRVERSQYNYIYLKGSDVFHRKSCPNWLNAADEKDICGSVLYKTAAEGRRPCGFCKPMPPVGTPQKQKNTTPDVPKQITPGKPNPEAIVDVRLLTGIRTQMRRGKIVGQCRNSLHPGAIDKGLFKSHDCLGKKCFYFQANPVSFYLESLEEEKRAKKQHKDQLRTEKQKKLEEENELKRIQQLWQEYLDEIDSDMEIIRIERDPAKEFRIFYVSDNRFADGNLFPVFLKYRSSCYYNDFAGNKHSTAERRERLWHTAN